MIIIRLLSPGPWLVGTTKVYPAFGADIVMESFTLKTPGTANECNGDVTPTWWGYFGQVGSTM
jgi:hypothetical protein